MKDSKEYQKEEKPKDKDKEEMDPTLANSEPVITLGSDDDLVDRELYLPFNTINQPLYRFKLNGRNQKVRVVGRAGMLYRINVDGNLRWYAGDREDFFYEMGSGSI